MRSGRSELTVIKARARAHRITYVLIPTYTYLYIYIRDCRVPIGFLLFRPCRLCAILVNVPTRQTCGESQSTTHYYCYYCSSPYKLLDTGAEIVASLVIIAAASGSSCISASVRARVASIVRIFLLGFYYSFICIFPVSAQCRNTGMPSSRTRYDAAPPRALALILIVLLQPVRPDRPTTTTTGFWASGVPAVLRLPGTVARALNRIRQSTRDQRLTEDLWLERLPFGRDAESIPDRQPADVLELADAVFDTHRLSWRNAVVPGVDFNVYKDRTQAYRFYVARNRQNHNGNSGDYIYMHTG